MSDTACIIIIFIEKYLIWQTICVILYCFGIERSCVRPIRMIKYYFNQRNQNGTNSATSWYVVMQLRLLFDCFDFVNVIPSRFFPFFTKLLSV